jgi:HNH endonuclease
VIDTTMLDENGRPKVDWGLPIHAPFSAVLDLARTAVVHVVVTDGNGNIVKAPGELDLERTTRLANRAQRRALHALYATCAVPGCCVRWEYTKLHHIKWWRHGGPTDLRNLIPLCQRHHDRVHTGGWILELGKDRALTIRLPNGTTMTTGPPNRDMR